MQARDTLAPMGWTSIVKDILDFTFPPICPGCNRRAQEPDFCGPCSAEIATVPAANCPRCAQPFRSGPDHLCARCNRNPPNFGTLRPCSIYSRHNHDTPLARTIHGLKYNRDVSLAWPLARLIERSFPTGQTFDSVVPVPLHIDRLRWRGFNQALLLARPLAKRRSWTMDPSLLKRLRPTAPQVGLGEQQRKRNIQGAFEVTNACRGRRILLVDDVYTTGATINECARILLDAGAKCVDAAVLARAK